MSTRAPARAARESCAVRSTSNVPLHASLSSIVKLWRLTGQLKPVSSAHAGMTGCAATQVSAIQLMILIGSIMTQDWFARNPRARRDMLYGAEQRRVIDPDGVPELLASLAACPVHKPTPLPSLPARAAELGIGELRVKDESQRFGFGAFKALGGVYAVGMALARAVQTR